MSCGAPSAFLGAGFAATFFSSTAGGVFGFGAGFFLGGGYIFQTIGLANTGAAITGFVTGLYVILTPLFAAVMSALVLGDLPQTFHFAASALIVGGIVVSSRR